MTVRKRISVRSTVALSTVLALVGVVACRQTPTPSASPSARGLAGDVVAAAQDSAALREAVAAVNAAVRALPDCDQAGPALATARQRIDELTPRVTTVAGQTSLASLRQQLDRVSQACP